ncbi:MAG TPA: GMC family oxidoreductase N-terminal domain-containing protein, partial [Gaiellaceae bacterium]|nr:GMC family oxidoreductase N-terminal domain-containing protein [Gaiellaceae bacterium]
MTPTLLKGSFAMPKENDSAFLLDRHKRGLQNLDRMKRYRDRDVVDLVIVGAGAGGGVLAQRLARKGWSVVVLEKGPLWDPDRDWVSDEKGAGQAGLYWTDNRIVAGNDPIELGKNNSGQGVGGSMTHFAGYVPRLHPSDFEVRTRDGVAVDWPISYWDLKESFERVERELPVAGEHWPWGDPHGYPHSPHPISGAAYVAWQGARAYGIEMRVGPVAITNGVFGNRPHCIYRGFCLEGCKVNAKASPLVTHLPDAIEHGCEIRADSMAVRVEIDDATGRASGVTYVKDGEERFQRADAVAVCGY